MTRYRSGSPGRAVLCALCTALALAGMSPVVLSQSPGAALPSLQGVSQLAGTVGSKRASLIAKIAPQLKAGLTAQEAAAVLGSADELNGWDRARAVQSIARANKLGPLDADASLMLQGTTESSRAAGIADLAPYLKANLTAQQAAPILGSTGELESWDRARAIQSIARSRTLGPLDAEASQMLQGTTASSRAASVADIAPYLKTDLTAPQAAAILGSTNELEGWDRARAIQSIARAKKLGPLGADAALMLKGTSESSRAAAIADLASYLKNDLAAQEAAAILGSVDELKGWDRARAIQSIARTKKLAPLGQEGALLLKGSLESSRAAGIADLAPYLETDLTAAQAAAILGTADEVAGWDRARAIQSIARAGKVRPGLSEAELAPVLDGTTGASRAAAIADLTPSQREVPQIASLWPSTVMGSVKPHAVVIRGSAFDRNASVVVKWGNATRTMSRDRVKYVSPTEIETTIFAAVEGGRHIWLLNSDGKKSNEAVLKVEHQLEAFRCMRPLLKTASDGLRLGPDDWRRNPLYHAYLCIFDGGKRYCGGLAPKRGKGFIPGEGTLVDDTFSFENCTEIEAEACTKRCLLRAVLSPGPLSYFVGPSANCQAWVLEQISECRGKCGEG